MHDERKALRGCGGVDLEEVEQMVGGDVGFAADEQDGEDAVFANGLVERGDEVLLGDGAFGEVLLHELVFAFGDEFDENFVLEPGMVLVLEPVVWEEGTGGYRSEEIIVITKESYIRLTDYPYHPYGD